MSEGFESMIHNTNLVIHCLFFQKALKQFTQKISKNVFGCCSSLVHCHLSGLDMEFWGFLRGVSRLDHLRTGVYSVWSFLEALPRPIWLHLSPPSIYPLQANCPRWPTLTSGPPRLLRGPLWAEQERMETALGLQR